MSKEDIAYDHYFPQVNKILSSTGLLLASGHPDRPTNAMTIGWGNLGTTWGLPIWAVLVRPSRFTYDIMEDTGDFTVCVPGPDLAKAVAYCGCRSGRNEDKLAKLGLKVSSAREVTSGVIEACPIVYECKIVGKSDIVPEMLAQSVKADFYPQGDYHRVYFGQVLAAYADKDAAPTL